MENHKLSRRGFLKLSARLAAGVAAGSLALENIACSPGVVHLSVRQPS
jgi:hypothetical protein